MHDQAATAGTASSLAATVFDPTSRSLPPSSKYVSNLLLLDETDMMDISDSYSCKSSEDGMSSSSLPTLNFSSPVSPQSSHVPDSQHQEPHHAFNATDCRTANDNTKVIGTILEKLYRDSVGVCERTKIAIVPQVGAKFGNEELYGLAALAIKLVGINGSAQNLQIEQPIELLSELQLQNSLHFHLYHACPTDADDRDSNNNRLCTDLRNTLGDGYCAFRASNQAEHRHNNPCAILSTLKLLDQNLSSTDLGVTIEKFLHHVRYMHPPLQALEMLKIQSSLWALKTRPDDMNPPHCYQNGNNLQFMPFPIMLFDFPVGESQISSVEGVDHNWGKLTTVSYSVFKKFFDPGNIKLTLTQLLGLSKLSNDVGFCSGHFFIMGAQSERNNGKHDELKALSLATTAWLQGVSYKIQTVLSTPELDMITAWVCERKRQHEVNDAEQEEATALQVTSSAAEDDALPVSNQDATFDANKTEYLDKLVRHNIISLHYYHFVCKGNVSKRPCKILGGRIH